MRLQLKSILPPRDLGWNRVRAVCSLPDCHNKLLMRFVPRNRQGIFVGEQWYCSADCFSRASREILASLSTAEVVEVPRHPRLSLGLALLTKGYLTTEQLRIAMAESELEKTEMQATLLERGWVNEKHLAAARAVQWGYPVLGQDLSAHSVVADLPAALFRACSATPLYYSGENKYDPESKRLVLGFVHHVDHSLLQSIEEITGCRAEPCFITPAELTRQLDRLSGPRGYQEAVVEHPGAAPNMARTLGGYALQVAATQAAFTRCRSFLWVRLTGNKGTMDVVFDLKEEQAVAGLSADVVEFSASRKDRLFARRANERR